jgi:hypothetical protein
VTAVTEEQDRRTVSRLGTARALVLLAAVLAVAASALLFLAVVVLGPGVLKDVAGSAMLGTGVCCAVVLAAAIAASLLAVRARTVGAVLGRGFGVLVAGGLLGLAVLLLLFSAT